MRIYRQRVTEALDAVAAGLAPCLERELRTIYKDRWQKVAGESFRNGRGRNGDAADIEWDAHAALTVMWDQWNTIFRHKLGPSERSLVSELREFRNRWAHQTEFDFDDCYRVLDSTERLLTAIEASEAARVAKMKRDVFRVEFERQARAGRQRLRRRRRLMQDLAVYSFSCAAVVFAVLSQFGGRFWLLAVGIVAFFGFLGWQRTGEQVSGFVGAHECFDCGKIVYSEDCPYCVPAPPPAAPPASAASKPEVSARSA